MRNIRPKSRLRQYRHHAVQTAYIPAPRKGWHYEDGKLIANRRTV